MINYISQIQKKLITQYGFEKNEQGLPKDVPDGTYPMEINGKKDNVKIVNGYINCCNFDN